MNAPQGYAIGPARLELPAGARNRRKISVKIRKKRLLRGVATKGTIPLKSNIYYKTPGILSDKTMDHN